MSAHLDPCVHTKASRWGEPVGCITCQECPAPLKPDPVHSTSVSDAVDRLLGIPTLAECISFIHKCCC